MFIEGGQGKFDYSRLFIPENSKQFRQLLYPSCNLKKLIFETCITVYGYKIPLFGNLNHCQFSGRLAPSSISSSAISLNRLGARIVLWGRHICMVTLPCTFTSKYTMREGIMPHLCSYCGGAVHSIISFFTQLYRSGFNLDFETVYESI